MNLQQANFEDLITTYYYGTSAYEAAGHLVGLITREQSQPLATLLRDYRKRAVNMPSEIKFREAVDDLMICCSAMELASLIGFIPIFQQTDFGSKILLILENKYVRLYYEEFYPTKLPQLLRCRLAGAHHVINGTELYSNFMAFLALDRRFMEKLNNCYLLRMLDSFTIKEYRFSDVVNLLSTPNKFIELLLVAPDKRDVMSQTLNEFSSLMQFCFDLRKLLILTESQPLFQSAIWNHYSYWFQIIGKELSEQLGEALQQFIKWKPVINNKDTINTIYCYVTKAKAVLSELTSNNYSIPVDDLLDELNYEVLDFEIIYILKPALGEDVIKEVTDKVLGIILTYKGECFRLDDWGVRQLAYPIKKYAKGRYCYLRFNGRPDLIGEMERCLKLDENVLRYQRNIITKESVAKIPSFVEFDTIEVDEDEEVSEDTKKMATKEF
jgi:small subunit ribosomal protein S6